MHPTTPDTCHPHRGGDDAHERLNETALRAPLAGTPPQARVLRPVPDQTGPPELATLRREVIDGPSARATEAQHARGKFTARERIELLFDAGVFHEFERYRRHEASGFGLEDKRYYTDGVITGWGMVHGRRVFAYAHDFRIFGGALGRAHAEKIHKLYDLAMSTGNPVVGLCDGAGARIQEGVTALAGFGGIFQRNVACSGRIPQISVVLGPCAGGSAYSPALTDFVFAVKGSSHLFVTGPDVVTAVTGAAINHEELGGANVHASESGVVGFVHDDESTCIEEVRYLLSFLPANSGEQPPDYDTDDPADRSCPRLAEVVPAESFKAYDIKTVVKEIVDDGDYFEVHERWARNLVCAFARIDGRSVGIVANQPMHLAGALDIAASEKGARFVRTCDSFNIPIITLVDVPGFMPGLDQEHSGIIRHGAKLLYAYCAATVPRIQVILRKAYGGAYIVMDSRSVGADLSYAWPANEIAVMGAEGAANTIFRRQIREAEDPEHERALVMAQYQAELAHPMYAAERGLVDDVIDPAETRAVLADGLAMLESKTSEREPTRGNPPQ